MDSEGIKKRKMRAHRLEWSYHTTFAERKCLIFHEQYNTRHEVSAIPDEVRRKIRSKPSRPEIQQGAFLHLFLESPVGRHSGIALLSKQTPPQPSQSAYGGGTEAHPGHAPEKPHAGSAGTVVPVMQTRLYPTARIPLPCHETPGTAAGSQAEKGVHP